MDWNTVLGFHTFEWSASRAYCPIVQSGDSYWDTQACEGMEVTGGCHCPDSLRVNVLCCWEHQAHHAWEEVGTRICNGKALWDGKLLWTTGWGGTTQSPLGSCSPDASQFLLEHIIPGERKHAPLRGEKVGVLGWHIPFSVHLLMPHSADSPGQKG